MKQVLVLIPALIHVYVFILESFLWGKPRTNAIFGLTPDEAKVTRGFAFNQGFYNLFIAVGIGFGWGLLFIAPAGSATVAGLVLALFGNSSLVAAGLVLIVSSPSRYRSALIQAVPAAIAVVALLV